jgi:very-short-patch-repair endonuclease
MRKEPTPWEQKLWYALKQGRLGGFKFRRQQPIGRYIADFYNADKKLLIELDGSHHSGDVDKSRDAQLNKLGYTVLHIWNNELDTNFDGVLTRILEVLQASPHRIAALSGSPSRGEHL